MMITAKVMVTDVVRSTEVLSRGGAELAERQRILHDELVGAVVEVFGGDVVKSTGDGALALLPSADLLVRAGSAVSEAAERTRLLLRVGLATGDVIRTASDCHGEASVVASRLCALADAGQTLVATSTAVVRGRRYDPPLRSVGGRSLKGFAEEFQVLEVVRSTATATASMTRDPVSLTGRDAALAAVRAACLDADARLVLVRGEPGVGKTELVRGVAAQLDEMTSVWIAFDASIADGFDRWCGALDAHASRLPVGALAVLGRERLERLAAFLPSIASRLPVAPVSLVGDGDRELFFEALTAVVASLGDAVLLVLDDIQWAGATATAFLCWLRAHEASGVRVLATCRPPVPDSLVELGALVVDLDGLAADDLREVLRLRGATPDVAETAIARAGGNPFLAIVAAAAGSEDLSSGSAVDPVTHRFLSLDRDVVDVLATAALVGRTIDLPLLEQLVSVPSDIHRALEIGLRTGLLRTEGAGLRFTHDLVREAAAAKCAPPRQAAIHAAAALAYRGREDAPMEATHLLAGYAALDPLEGARRMRSTLEALDLLGAFEEAYAMAIRFVGIVEHDQRCGAREQAIALIAALTAAHRYPALGAENKRLAVLAGHAALTANDPEMIAEAALLRGQSGTFGQVDPGSITLIDEALRRVGFSDQGLSARLMAMRAFHLITFDREGAQARQDAHRAADMARASGDERSLADVLISYAYVLLAGSDIQLQATLVNEALDLEPRLSAAMAAHVRTHAARSNAVVSLQVGDRNGFEAARHELRSWSQRWNRIVLTNLETMWRGVTANLDGSPADAELHVRSLLDPKLGDENFVRSAGVIVAVSHRWRGTPNVVSPLLRSLADQQPEHALVQGLAATALALGAHQADANKCLDRVLLSPRPLIDDVTIAAQVASLVEACALTGRSIPPVVSDALDAFSGQMLILAWGADVPGAADRFMAIDAVLRGDRELAAARFNRAEALELRISEPHLLRTRVWRHAMLGDTSMPAIPPALAGLHLEANVLRQHAG